MIDIEKYDENFVQDMSTIKFARGVWPQMVKELRAAREFVGACERWSKEKITRDYHPVQQYLGVYHKAIAAATKGDG